MKSNSPKIDTDKQENNSPKCGYTLKNMEKIFPAIPQKPTSVIPQKTIPAITESDITRLQEQCQDIEKHIKNHRSVMIYLYKISYASIFTINILVILGGICIFFISKAGWDKANNSLLNLFIVCSLASLFLTHHRLIFQDNINLKANRDLYVAYAILYNKLLSYSSTGQVSQASEDIKKEDIINPIDPKTFIHYIDSNIAKIYQVSLNWNLEDNFQIQDVIKQINTDSGIPEK